MAHGTSAADQPVVTGSNDYSAVYYHDYSGPPYTYDEPHWQRFFGGIADQIIALFAPATAYDAGCAKGFMVRALAERGVDARGGDISEHAIAEAPEELAPRLEVKDLTEPLADRYDVITCIEVLEHMAPDDARIALQNLCAATDVIVLSTTPDDFTEPTHINIRQAAGWAQDFASYGFFRRVDVDASFLSPWAVVFAKQSQTVLTVVSGYETLLQPLLREVVEKRQALLELRRQLDDACAPVMVERENLIVERDTAVHQRNEAAAELATVQSSELARLALVDELMGVRAELAQLKVHSEQAIVEASREAVRLREMLAASAEEVAQMQVAKDTQLAHADQQVVLARQETENAVAAIRTSTSWKIGQAALLPVRVARRFRRG